MVAKSTCFIRQLRIAFEHPKKGNRCQHPESQRAESFRGQFQQIAIVGYEVVGCPSVSRREKQIVVWVATGGKSPS
jgi:hypothetical protein